MSKKQESKRKAVSTRSDQEQTDTMEAPKGIQLVSIGTLKANPTNPRVLRDEKFIKLKNSIQSFPDMLNYRSVVAVTDTDGKLMVLGGNMRLRAMQDLGIREVPVMIADHWTEDQRREFIIKDNVGFGEWSWEDLANEWDTAELSDWGLELPIPTNFDVDDFFKDGGSDGGKEAGLHSIVLNYTEEEFHKVIARLGELGGSREQAIYKALGL